MKKLLSLLKWKVMSSVNSVILWGEKKFYKGGGEVSQLQFSKELQFPSLFIYLR